MSESQRKAHLVSTTSEVSYGVIFEKVPNEVTGAKSLVGTFFNVVGFNDLAHIDSLDVFHQQFNKNPQRLVKIINGNTFLACSDLIPKKISGIAVPVFEHADFNFRIIDAKLIPITKDEVLTIGNQFLEFKGKVLNAKSSSCHLM